MKYKYKKEFLQWMFNHIRQVQDNMMLLENNLDKLPLKLNQYDLVRRCIYHDSDKFRKNMVDNYYKFYCHRYVEFQEAKTVSEDIKNTIRLHHKINRHHVDFHIVKDKPFTNIDLCEMCCDMMARTEEESDDLNKIFSYCENGFFTRHPITLNYKDKMYKIFSLLIELKK